VEVDITGQHSCPQSHLSLLGSLTSYGHGGTWRRKWERLKITGGQGSHNKPIGCGASGAYTLGPADEEEEEGPGQPGCEPCTDCSLCASGILTLCAPGILTLCARHTDSLCVRHTDPLCIRHTDSLCARHTDSEHQAYRLFERQAYWLFERQAYWLFECQAYGLFELYSCPSAIDLYWWNLASAQFYVFGKLKDALEISDSHLMAVSMLRFRSGFESNTSLFTTRAWKISSYSVLSAWTSTVTMWKNKGLVTKL